MKKHFFITRSTKPRHSILVALASIVSFLVFTLSVTSSAIAQDCSSQFKSTLRASAGDYIRQAQSRQTHVVLPQFSNPHAEQLAEKTWGGVNAPRAIEDQLVPGTRLIGHGLNGANEPGLVKSSSGNMVHLRAEYDGLSTNIGVNFLALKENSQRAIKSYVRDSAKAVIIFVHGGGTKTTGHHVAAQLMDYMSLRGVDVISWDLKWHGEGSRTSPESIKKELELIRELTRKLTAGTEKPIFLMGHSMGGVIADLYMRNFPLDSLIKGVVSLSTVADVAPGKSHFEKRQREAEIEILNLNNPAIPADERNLGAELARAGKISPTCGFYCDVLMTGVDWSPTSHGGKKYVPALYVIGEGDALYQGNQSAFAQGVAALPNVEFIVYGPRRDIKAKDGQKVIIGHLIFDHKPLLEFESSVSSDIQKKYYEGKLEKADFERLRSEGKISLGKEFQFEDIKAPETFVRIRNFISRVTGLELPRIESVRDSMDDVVQEYIKNLAFREFAKTHQFLNMKATPAGVLLGQEIAGISKALGALQALEKKGTLNAEQAHELRRLRAENARLVGIVSNKGEVHQDRLESFQVLQKQYEHLRSQMTDQALGTIPQASSSIKLEIEKLKQTVNQLKRSVSSAERLVDSAILNRERLEVDSAYGDLMKQDEIVRNLSAEYLRMSMVEPGLFRPGLFENMPIEIKQAYEIYAKLSAVYQRKLANYETVLLTELAAGRFALPGAGKKESVEAAAKDIKRMNEDVRRLQIELELRSQNRARLWAEIMNLQLQMVRMIDQKYFVPEFYTVENLLSRTDLPRKELSSILQKIWADWNSVWAERPVGGDLGEGLY
jgi:pimeloyl-ACP methyl ester carboxylesterase